MIKMKKLPMILLATSFLIPNYSWQLHAEENSKEKTLADTQTLYFLLHNEVLENYNTITMPFDNALDGYNVTWTIQSGNFNEDTTPIYFQDSDAKRVSKITTDFNTTNIYFNSPGNATVETKACKDTNPNDCQPAKYFYVDTVNPQLEFSETLSELRYIQDQDELMLELEGKEARHWTSYYDLTWKVNNTDVIQLYDASNDRFTDVLNFGNGKETIQSFKKGKAQVQVDIVNKKNANIRSTAILDVNVKDLLADTTLFVNNNDVRMEAGGFLPFYTAPQSSQSIQNTSTANGLAVGFKNGSGQVNFDTYRYLIKTEIQDEDILRLIPYVKYNGMNIPLDEASKEAQKGQTFYAFQALKTGSTIVTFSYGDKTVVSKIRVSEKLNNRIELDPSGDASENEVIFTVSKDSLKQVSGDERPKVKLNLTKSAIDAMIMSSKEPNVKVTIRIPEEVRNQADIEQILISSNTMEAARNYKKNVTFRITNESDKLLYSWTFKGSELRQIGYDLDLSMDKQSVSEVYKIDMLAQDTRATILNFHHEGELPSLATVKVYVGDMGYKAKETLYMYYFDDANKALNNELKDENGFVVDENLYVEIPLSHCSSYVLTTKPLSEKELAIGNGDENIDNKTGQDIEETSGNGIKDGIAGLFTGANTGVISQIIMVLSVMMLAELAYVFAKKKLHQANEKTK